MTTPAVNRGQLLVVGLIGAVLLTLGISLLMRLMSAEEISWVGGTDLEIEFIVRDAETGEPIKEALIRIRAESGGFCKDEDEREFCLLTDGQGRVKHLCEQCMCFGTQSRTKDTFVVHLPWWWFEVSAPGYSASELTYLDDLPYRRDVQRGKGTARLVVTTKLRKGAA